MIHGSEPSRLFCDAILWSYHQEAIGYGHEKGDREVNERGRMYQ